MSSFHSLILSFYHILYSFVCGRKIAPTILLDVPKDSLIMNDEIFGPVLPIVTVKASMVDLVLT